MTIHHLAIFKIVCEEMNFTKAAKRLFMTQPAVSHVIADLETEAGTPLFERKAQKVFLNQRGKLLLEKTIRLLELYGEMEEELKDLEMHGVLRIGSSITIANFMLPSFIKHFEGDCPETPIEVIVDSAYHIVEKLERGEIDMAFVEGAFYIDQFEQVEISSYEIFPLCAASYLDGRDLEVDLPEFAAMKLLLREEGSAVRDVLDGLFMQRAVKAKAYWTSTNSQALLQAAKAGLGVAVLPGILARRELERGELMVLQVEGLHLENKNYVAYHKTNYMTEPMKKLLEIAKKPGI